MSVLSYAITVVTATAGKRVVRKLARSPIARDFVDNARSGLQRFHIDWLATQLNNADDPTDKIKTLKSYAGSKNDNVSVAAAIKLAEINRDGIVVPQNVNEAMEWFGIAAEKGKNPSLMSKLGQMHAEAGQPVKANYWYEQSIFTADQIKIQNVQTMALREELHYGFKLAAQHEIFQMANLSYQSQHDLIDTLFVSSPHVAVMRRGEEDKTPEAVAKAIWFMRTAAERLVSPSIAPASDDMIVRKGLLDFYTPELASLDHLANQCEGKILMIELGPREMLPEFALKLEAMLSQRSNMVTVVVARNMGQIEGSLRYEDSATGLQLTPIGFDEPITTQKLIPVPAVEPIRQLVSALAPVSPSKNPAFNWFEATAGNMGVTFMGTREQVKATFEDLTEAHKGGSPMPLHPGHLLIDTLKVAEESGRMSVITPANLQAGYERMVGIVHHFAPK